MADRHWVGGTANWDGTAGTKWSLTPGGVGGETVPTNVDAVFFDASSGAVSVTITSAANALSIDCTGFTGTLTGSSNLTVAGNVIFVAGMTLSCTGVLTITNTSSLTSGGKTWGGNLSITSGVTTTLIDNCIISGDFTSNGTPVLLGAKTLTIGGSLSCPGTTANNCNLTFNGTGTINNPISSNTNCLITINTSGTITLGASLSFSGNVSFTHTAGNVDPGTNTLTLSSIVGTYNINGIILNNLTVGGVSTITLGQNINVNNTTTAGTLGQTTTLNGNKINTLHFTKAGTTAIINGTTNINFTGVGNWTDTTTTSGGYVSNNITINSGSVVTIVGSNHRYRTGTITNLGKFLIDKNSSTFTFDATCTLINLHKTIFKTIIITGASVLTMNEFFSGSATIRTRIQSSNTTNYSITFQNKFEKYSKFIRISNATITNRNQLLVLTNKSNANITINNNLGIRYVNTLPNGISKNNATINTEVCFGIGNGFAADPMTR